MDGLYFLLSIVGIALVMRWQIANDRVAADRPTGGLLAMDDETKPAKRQSRDRRLLPSAESAAPPTRTRKYF